MSDPETRLRVMAAVSHLWEDYPDWRFGELITHLYGTVSPFYTYDETILRRYSEYINGLSWMSPKDSL